MGCERKGKPKFESKTEAAIRATYTQPGGKSRAAQTEKNKRGAGSAKPDILPRKKESAAPKPVKNANGKIGVPGAGKR